MEFPLRASTRVCTPAAMRTKACFLLSLPNPKQRRVNVVSAFQTSHTLGPPYFCSLCSCSSLMSCTSNAGRPVSLAESEVQISLSFPQSSLFFPPILQYPILNSLHLRVRMAPAPTYASEPQRCVRDFCVSLSDLSEVRLALNFPSRAGNL